MKPNHIFLFPAFVFLFFYLLNSSRFGDLDIFTDKLGMRFVLIPAGSFMMGSPESEEGRQWNEPLHKIIISKNFYMGGTEVTQEQWKKTDKYRLPTEAEWEDACRGFYKPMTKKNSLGFWIVRMQ